MNKPWLLPTAPAVRRRLLDAVAYLLLLLGALVMAGPFVWMVATALKTPAEQYSRNLIPSPATLDNFTQLWAKLPFARMIINSLSIAMLTTTGQLLTCAMAAFCFAVVRFRARRALFLALLATLMLPPQITLVPNFILFKWLGLTGTAAPLWLPAFWGGAFGTFLLRQYFLTIPFDLAEAARVDGASLIQIFWSIYLPLARPALAALAIYSFLGAWNDLLGPLIYLPADLNKTTLTVGLALFQTQYAGHWTVMMAGALVSIAPMILLFLVAQRQFIEGIALSGVKR
ncbi:MAG: carbohydrate ABC transporter permease [Kouleothrix sp.]|jgi:ABC-type glycerol-3-phosphate transport system permease component|nr:carbohydrate ABC transporter permease [Kouleothrix sp.]